MIVLLLPLLGCHVFETVAIDCVRGMPCATGGGGDTAVDTDTGADTGDSGPDTSTPVLAPSRRTIASVTGDRGDRVYAYDATGTTLYLWKDYDGGGTGPVDFDPAESLGVMATPGKVVWLIPDQDPIAVDIPEEVKDVATVGRKAWLTTRDNVYVLEAGSGDGVAVLDQPADEVGAVAINPAGGVWFTTVMGGVPSLHAMTSDGQLSTVQEAFDTTGARARILFAGPDGEPYVCSTAGGVYRVADLAAGVRTPIVYFDGGLSDVTDCGWDDGDGAWLLFSASTGVVRVDAQGRGTVGIQAPEEFSLVRGNFF